MIDIQTNAPRQTDDVSAEPRTSAAESGGPKLDVVALMTDLLDRAAQAQVSLIEARCRADRRGSDEALLQLRAATLLLASIPAPEPDARRFAVLAAALLAAEDHDASSYARRMVEHAIRLGDDEGFRVIPSATGTPSDG